MDQDIAIAAMRRTYPDYITAAIPFMLAMVVVEFLISIFKKKKVHHLNDSISSLVAGSMEQIWSSLIPSVFSKSLEVLSYLYVYNNYHILEVSEDSALAWFMCFLGVDLAYYWFHRMAHEINVAWAAHIVHHSSEEYNFTTALRQSVFQLYFSWVSYLPLAFFIPPPLFMMHKQFNTLYQFWIHTRLINTVGPLEWIINTPSHHRVHHGRNRPYIDKNYAGILIIWDRIFGTFEPEKEEPVYGLVHPLDSFDPVWTQIHHYVSIFNGIYTTQGFWNKLSVLVKGPGWAPGKARLGDLNDIPLIDDTNKIRKGPSLPFVLSVYVLLHFVVVITMLFILLSLHTQFTPVLVVILSIFQVYSFTSFGAMFDNKIYAFHLELTRLILFVGVEVFFWLLYKDEFVFLWYKDTSGTTFLGMHRPLKAVRTLYVFSILWLIGRYAIFPFYGETKQHQHQQQQQQRTVEQEQEQELKATIGANKTVANSHYTTNNNSNSNSKSVKVE